MQSACQYLKTDCTNLRSKEFSWLLIPCERILELNSKVLSIGTIVLALFILQKDELWFIVTS
jgi:hypothetical protein